MRLLRFLLSATPLGAVSIAAVSSGAMLLVTPQSAHAQEAQVESSGETVTEDAAVPNRVAAARAYDRGSAYYLNEDFARAARWFETAYRLSPAAPALTQAMRAQIRAGHTIRAANLALRLRGLHSDDAEASRLAQDVIDQQGSAFVLLELRCEGCDLEIEGRIWSYPAAYLWPRSTQRVAITLGDAREQHEVLGEAGEHIVLGPPASSPAARETDPGTPVSAMPVAPGVGADSASGPSPWLFCTGVGLTVVSAAVLIWSGVDTLEGVDAFNAMPTREAFDEGEAKELRTNVMIGVTAGLAALTALSAIFTDWGGSEEPSTTVTGFTDGQAGMLVLHHAF